MTTKLPDPFQRWFRSAMSTIREIWPWTRFIVYSPTEIIIGLGGPIRYKAIRPANDNDRSTAR